MAGRLKCARCRAPIPQSRRRRHAEHCSDLCRVRAARAAYFARPRGKEATRRANAAYHRRHRAGGTDGGRLRYLKKRGLTLSDYNTVSKAQGGVCGVCRNPPGPGQSLRIRRGHAGQIAALLCRRCNGTSIATDRWARHEDSAEHWHRMLPQILREHSMGIRDVQKAMLTSGIRLPYNTICSWLSRAMARGVFTKTGSAYRTREAKDQRAA